MDQLTEKCRLKYLSSQKTEAESNKQYYDRIREEFLNNVFKNKYTFKGLPVRFQKHKNSKGEVECFYHTITAHDADGRVTRKVDLQRYQKCLLVFVVLDECVCNQIQCPQLTIKPDYNNENRVSIFCAKYEYVVILEKKSTRYDYITGFPVSENSLDKYL